MRLSTLRATLLPGLLDEVGRPVEIVVERLAWPQSLADQAHRRAIVEARDLAAENLTSAEYAQKYGRR